MLRLAALFAILALGVGPAWADPVESGIATAGKAADAIILTGPIGALFILVVVGLVAACGLLGLVIRALWGTIKDRDGIIATLQDKRAADAATSSKLIAETATAGSAAISANTAAQADANNRLQKVIELTAPLGSDHTRLVAGLDRNADKIDDLAKVVGAGCRA